MTGSGDATLQRATLALAAVLVVFGLVRAGAVAWICDDAFVSLRYADHLVAGHGLVYNPGERVEGYTNFLWTLALAGALAAGFPDVASAEWLGIACYAGLALLLLAAGWRRSRREGTPWLPLAAGVVLVSPDFHTWASGGLETSLFALLALAGALLVPGANAHAGRALGAGACLALLCLTRLDGLLLGGGLVAGVAWAQRWPLRSVVLVATPVALTVGLWGVAKLAYYGELLPTAFYSKSVLRPYWSQGLVYLGLYLAKNWFLPLLALPLAVLCGRGAATRSPERVAAASEGRRVSLAIAASGLLYLTYVVHVGGDFMFARRILPVVPLLLLALERELPSLPVVRARGAAALLVLAAALPYPVYDADTPRIRGVADEPRFYTDEAIAKRRLQAEVVGAALRDTGARVVFEGGMCVFGYYSRLPYLVEITGLTQYSLARLPLDERSWVGHEKRASDDWLDANGIHLIVSQRFPPVARPASGDTTDLVTFGGVALARVHRYDDAVMDRLRGVEGVSFVPIERVIERRRREIDRASPERAQEILERLAHYYLDGAGETGAAIAAELRARIDAKRS